MDVAGVVYLPHFAKDPADKEAKIKKLFEETLPKYLDEIEKVCGESKFLVGDTLTIADFFVAGLYTNYLHNEHITFAKDEFAAILAKYPKFQAYGERYAEENKDYLSKRGNFAI